MITTQSAKITNKARSSHHPVLIFIQLLLLLQLLFSRLPSFIQLYTFIQPLISRQLLIFNQLRVDRIGKGTIMVKTFKSQQPPISSHISLFHSTSRPIRRFLCVSNASIAFISSRLNIHHPIGLVDQSFLQPLFQPPIPTLTVTAQWSNAGARSQIRGWRTTSCGVPNALATRRSASEHDQCMKMLCENIMKHLPSTPKTPMLLEKKVKEINGINVLSIF